MNMQGKDYTFSASIGQYANCINEEWGMLYLLMSIWSYAPGEENEYTITGLPADICVDVPAFTNGTNYEIPGSECAVLHIENDKVRFTGKGQQGGRKQPCYVNSESVHPYQ